MCDPVSIMAITVAAGGFSAYQKVQEGKATAKMYQYQSDALEQEKGLVQRTADVNSKFNQDAAMRDSATLSRNVAQLEGAQKVAAAANGIGGGSVTSADIAVDTYDKFQMDKLAIQYNADMKSWQIQNEAKSNIWGLSEQQKQLRAAGKNAKKAGYMNAASTLLNSASSFAGNKGLLAKS